MATLNRRLDIICLQSSLIALSKAFISHEAAVFKDIFCNPLAILIMRNANLVKHAGCSLTVDYGHYSVRRAVLK
jgi:hypothetical protein